MIMRRFASLLAFLAIPAAALADGFMRPIPPHDRPGVRVQAFAVKYHHVTVTIDNQVAKVDIDQIFINPNPFAVDAEYTFPIPDYAAIDKLSLWVDGKEQNAELMDKDKARQYYENMVRTQRDPALLEYIHNRAFRLSVSGIAPNGEKRVRLAYSHLVTKENGLCTFAYPLNTEKFSSKNLDDCTVSINLKAEAPLKNVYSPTHPISIAKKNATEFHIDYSEKNVKPDRDFVLYYASDESDLGLNLVTHKDYFMLFASPKYAETAEVDPKDIVFVADTSGSMAGEKIRQAKAALQQCIDLLNEADRFSIVTFSTEVHPLFEKLEPAEKHNRVRARKFIEQIAARGGTNIHDAMDRGLAYFGKTDRPCYLIFMTDGLPTISETDPAKIVKAIREKNEGRVRVFNFGVGYDVNSVLLNQVAADNKGISDYVLPEEDIEKKVAGFSAKITYPALSDPKVSIDGVEIREVYPRVLPDIFYGGQLVAYGRFDGTGEREVRLTGKFRGKEMTRSMKVQLAANNPGHDYIPGFWAMTKIGYLLDQIRINGEQDELKQEVIRLSKAYGIMTPYTSYLVIQDQARKPADQPPAVPMPMPAPGKWGGARGGEPLPQEDRQGFEGKEHSGGGAVRAAKALNDMKKAEKNASEGERERQSLYADTIKNVAGKTFYRADNKWHDGALKQGYQAKQVKFLSDEYWALLKEHPELAKFQSLGASMIVVLKDQVYEIVE
jgi:Ca-activated chloride channel family protein